jgi:hypothetical protein
MITNTGKNILSKFLISQAPAYASYIAIGCGPKPLSIADEDEFGIYSDTKTLDFEMLRLPIVSKGYIKDDDNVEKIVFTAELPTQERYEITEVGVYSAGSNPSAVGFDSRMLFTFSENEGWKYDDLAINLITDLDESSENPDSNTISVADEAFFFTSTNRIFGNANRTNRYERPRILNNSLAVVGDTSTLSYTGLELKPSSSGNDKYLKLTGTSVNLNRNAATDQLKVAFSVMNKNGNTGSEVPDNVKILIQFGSSSNSSVYANMQIDVDNGQGQDSDDALEHDFINNRYVVATQSLQDLYYKPGFSWGLVDEIRIYTSVTDLGAVSDKYYVALDGLRLENTTTQNPLYGLTGYTVFMTANGETVIKNQNTKNYIEFRFAIDVGVV